MLKKIINLGANYEMEDFIERRLAPVNIITLLLLVAIAIPFAILTLIFVPQLLVFPLAGVVTCVGVLIANGLGGIKYSRFFVAALPVYEINLYNAYLSAPAEEPMAGPYLIALGFVMVAFLVFDLKEWRALTFTSLLGTFGMIAWPFFRNFLNLDTASFTEATYYYIDSLRFGWLSYLMVSLGVIVAFGTMAGLATISKVAEKESQLAKEDAEKKNQEMEVQQKALEENLKKVEEAQVEERKRNWAVEGLAQVADILRSSKPSGEIFDDLVSLLVNYTKTNQGGLFVVHRDENTQEVSIKLESCYAYSRKKYLEQEFEAGQGLVGQAYLEGSYIYMTKVPTDYVNITSGLGESTASSVLIMPLKVNDVIEGIFELASFKELDEHEIEFLEKIGENVASFIQSNRVNVRTNQLLQEAKEQAEELQAQEEEMRQNMEELAATQEELGRKEKEYQRVIEELKTENKDLHEKVKVKAGKTKVTAS